MNRIPAALPQSKPTVLSTTVTGSGPGLLLAHGAGGSIEGNFAPVIEALAAGHRVVAPDLPGSGATPRSTEPLDLDDLADALVASAVAEGVETFTIVGYSLGTAVAVRAATRHPERVRGLILTAGLVRPDNRLRLSLDLWLDLLAREDLTGFARFVALTAFGPEFFNAIPAPDVEAFLATAAAGVPPGAADQAALVLSVDTGADLAGITVPTLVVATTHDLLVAPAGSRELAAGISGAEYAELATGHLPMVERAPEWQALIEKFLSARGL